MTSLVNWDFLVKTLFISVNCEWGSWNSFSSCTKTCGGGTKYRTRSKSVPEKNGGTCTGRTKDEENCNTQNCPGMKLSMLYILILHYKHTSTVHWTAGKPVRLGISYRLRSHSLN